MEKQWRDFEGGAWLTEVNVRNFIQKNYHPYDGDEAFLEGPTQDTLDLWDEVLELSKKEREAGGVLDMDTSVISTITWTGIFRQIQRKDCWFSNRKAIQAFSSAIWRYPHGNQSL